MNNIFTILTIPSIRNNRSSFISAWNALIRSFRSEEPSERAHALLILRRTLPFLKNSLKSNPVIKLSLLQCLIDLINGDDSPCDNCFIAANLFGKIFRIFSESINDIKKVEESDEKILSFQIELSDIGKIGYNSCKNLCFIAFNYFQIEALLKKNNYQSKKIQVESKQWFAAPDSKNRNHNILNFYSVKARVLILSSIGNFLEFEKSREDSQYYDLLYQLVLENPHESSFCKSQILKDLAFNLTTNEGNRRRIINLIPSIRSCLMQNPTSNILIESFSKFLSVWYVVAPDQLLTPYLPSHYSEYMKCIKENNEKGNIKKARDYTKGENLFEFLIEKLECDSSYVKGRQQLILEGYARRRRIDLLLKEKKQITIDTKQKLRHKLNISVAESVSSNDEYFYDFVSDSEKLENTVKKESLAETKSVSELKELWSSQNYLENIELFLKDPSIQDINIFLDQILSSTALIHSFQDSVMLPKISHHFIDNPSPFLKENYLLKFNSRNCKLRFNARNYRNTTTLVNRSKQTFFFFIQVHPVQYFSVYPGFGKIEAEESIQVSITFRPALQDAPSTIISGFVRLRSSHGFPLDRIELEGLSGRSIEILTPEIHFGRCVEDMKKTQKLFIRNTNKIPLQILCVNVNKLENNNTKVKIGNSSGHNKYFDNRKNDLKIEEELDDVNNKVNGEIFEVVPSHVFLHPQEMKYFEVSFYPERLDKIEKRNGSTVSANFAIIGLFGEMYLVEAKGTYGDPLEISTERIDFGLIEHLDSLEFEHKRELRVVNKDIDMHIPICFSCSDPNLMISDKVISPLSTVDIQIGLKIQKKLKRSESPTPVANANKNTPLNIIQDDISVSGTETQKDEVSSLSRMSMSSIYSELDEMLEKEETAISESIIHQSNRRNKHNNDKISSASSLISEVIQDKGGNMILDLNDVNQSKEGMHLNYECETLRGHFFRTFTVSIPGMFPIVYEVHAHIGALIDVHSKDRSIYFPLTEKGKPVLMVLPLTNSSQERVDFKISGLEETPFYTFVSSELPYPPSYESNLESTVTFENIDIQSKIENMALRRQSIKRSSLILSRQKNLSANIDNDSDLDKALLSQFSTELSTIKLKALSNDGKCNSTSSGCYNDKCCCLSDFADKVKKPSNVLREKKKRPFIINPHSTALLYVWYANHSEGYHFAQLKLDLIYPSKKSYGPFHLKGITIPSNHSTLNQKEQNIFRTKVNEFFVNPSQYTPPASFISNERKGIVHDLSSHYEYGIEFLGREKVNDTGLSEANESTKERKRRGNVILRGERHNNNAESDSYVISSQSKLIRVSCDRKWFYKDCLYADVVMENKTDNNQIVHVFLIPNSLFSIDDKLTICSLGPRKSRKLTLKYESSEHRNNNNSYHKSNVNSIEPTGYFDPINDGIDPNMKYESAQLCYIDNENTVGSIDLFGISGELIQVDKTSSRFYFEPLEPLEPSVIGLVIVNVSNLHLKWTLVPNKGNDDNDEVTDLFEEDKNIRRSSKSKLELMKCGPFTYYKQPTLLPWERRYVEIGCISSVVGTFQLPLKVHYVDPYDEGIVKRFELPTISAHCGVASISVDKTFIDYGDCFKNGKVFEEGIELQNFGKDKLKIIGVTDKSYSFNSRSSNIDVQTEKNFAYLNIKPGRRKNLQVNFKPSANLSNSSISNLFYNGMTKCVNSSLQFYYSNHFINVNLLARVGNADLRLRENGVERKPNEKMKLGMISPEGILKKRFELKNMGNVILIIGYIGKFGNKYSNSKSNTIKMDNGSDVGSNHSKDDFSDGSPVSPPNIATRRLSRSGSRKMTRKRRKSIARKNSIRKIKRFTNRRKSIVSSTGAQSRKSGTVDIRKENKSVTDASIDLNVDVCSSTDRFLWKCFNEWKVFIDDLVPLLDQMKEFHSFLKNNKIVDIFSFYSFGIPEIDLMNSFTPEMLELMEFKISPDRVPVMDWDEISYQLAKSYEGKELKPKSSNENNDSSFPVILYPGDSIWIDVSLCSKIIGTHQSSLFVNCINEKNFERISSDDLSDKYSSEGNNKSETSSQNTYSTSITKRIEDLKGSKQDKNVFSKSPLKDQSMTEETGFKSNSVHSYNKKNVTHSSINSNNAKNKSNRKMWNNEGLEMFTVSDVFEFPLEFLVQPKLVPNIKDLDFGVVPNLTVAVRQITFFNEGRETIPWSISLKYRKTFKLNTQMKETNEFIDMGAENLLLNMNYHYSLDSSVRVFTSPSSLPSSSSSSASSNKTVIPKVYPHSLHSPPFTVFPLKGLIEPNESQSIEIAFAPHSFHSCSVWNLTLNTLDPSLVSAATKAQSKNSNSDTKHNYKLNSFTFHSSLTLRGIGSVAQLKLSQHSFDFGICQLGIKKTGSILMRNIRGLALQFNVKSNSRRFKLHPLEGVIRGGEALELQISFCPLSDRMYDGDVKINWEVMLDEKMVRISKRFSKKDLGFGEEELKVMGGGGHPDLFVPVEMIDFGMTALRGESERRLYIENRGNAEGLICLECLHKEISFKGHEPVEHDNIMLENFNKHNNSNSNFDQLTDGATMWIVFVPPNSKTPLDIVFSPQDIDLLNVYLIIRSSDNAHETYNVQMLGLVGVPQLKISEPDMYRYLDFGACLVGKESIRTINLSNIGELETDFELNVLVQKGGAVLPISDMNESSNKKLDKTKYKFANLEVQTHKKFPIEWLNKNLKFINSHFEPFSGSIFEITPSKGKLKDNHSIDIEFKFFPQTKGDNVHFLLQLVSKSLKEPLLGEVYGASGESLMEFEGESKIVDFGICRLGSTTPVTVYVQNEGTIGYQYHVGPDMVPPYSLYTDYQEALMKWSMDFQNLGFKVEYGGYCVPKGRSALTFYFTSIKEAISKTYVRIVSGSKYERIQLVGCGAVAKLVLQNEFGRKFVFQNPETHTKQKTEFAVLNESINMMNSDDRMAKAKADLIDESVSNVDFGCQNLRKLYRKVIFLANEGSLSTQFFISRRIPRCFQVYPMSGTVHGNAVIPITIGFFPTDAQIEHFVLKVIIPNESKPSQDQKGKEMNTEYQYDLDFANDESKFRVEKSNIVTRVMVKGRGGVGIIRTQLFSRGDEQFQGLDFNIVAKGVIVEKYFACYNYGSVETICRVESDSAYFTLSIKGGPKKLEEVNFSSTNPQAIANLEEKITKEIKERGTYEGYNKTHTYRVINHENDEAEREVTDEKNDIRYFHNEVKNPPNKIVNRRKPNSQYTNKMNIEWSHKGTSVEFLLPQEHWQVVCVRVLIDSESAYNGILSVSSVIPPPSGFPTLSNKFNKVNERKKENNMEFDNSNGTDDSLFSTFITPENGLSTDNTRNTNEANSKGVGESALTLYMTAKGGEVEIEHTGTLSFGTIGVRHKYSRTIFLTNNGSVDTEVQLYWLIPMESKLGILGNENTDHKENEKIEKDEDEQRWEEQLLSQNLSATNLISESKAQPKEEKSKHYKESVIELTDSNTRNGPRFWWIRTFEVVKYLIRNYKLVHNISGNYANRQGQTKRKNTSSAYMHWLTSCKLKKDEMDSNNNKNNDTNADAEGTSFSDVLGTALIEASLEKNRKREEKHLEQIKELEERHNNNMAIQYLTSGVKFEGSGKERNGVDDKLTVDSENINAVKMKKYNKLRSMGKRHLESINKLAEYSRKKGSKLSRLLANTKEDGNESGAGLLGYSFLDALIEANDKVGFQIADGNGDLRENKNNRDGYGRGIKLGNYAKTVTGSAEYVPQIRVEPSHVVLPIGVRVPVNIDVNLPSPGPFTAVLVAEPLLFGVYPHHVILNALGSAVKLTFEGSDSTDLDFGCVPIGQDELLSRVATNRGRIPIGFEVECNVPNLFVIPKQGILEPGEAISFSFVFRPLDQAFLQSHITFRTACSDPIVIPVRGQGGHPSLLVEVPETKQHIFFDNQQHRLGSDSNTYSQTHYAKDSNGNSSTNTMANSIINSNSMIGGCSAKLGSGSPQMIVDFGKSMLNKLSERTLKFTNKGTASIQILSVCFSGHQHGNASSSPISSDPDVKNIINTISKSNSNISSTFSTSNLSDFSEVDETQQNSSINKTHSDCNFSQTNINLSTSISASAMHKINEVNDNPNSKVVGNNEQTSYQYQSPPFLEGRNWPRNHKPITLMPGYSTWITVFFRPHSEDTYSEQLMIQCRGLIEPDSSEDYPTDAVRSRYRKRRFSIEIRDVNELSSLKSFVRSLSFSLKGIGREALLVIDPPSIKMMRSIVGATYKKVISLMNVGELDYPVRLYFSPASWVERFDQPHHPVLKQNNNFTKAETMANGEEEDKHQSGHILTRSHSDEFSKRKGLSLSTYQFILGPFEKKQITFFFQPLKTSKKRKYYLAIDSIYSQNEIPLILECGTANLIVETKTIDFGLIEKDGKPSNRILEMRNEGTMPLKFRIRHVRDEKEDYSFVTNRNNDWEGGEDINAFPHFSSSSYKGTVAPMKSYQIVFTSLNKVEGSFSQEILLETESVDVSCFVNVKGNCRSAKLEFSTSNINFGNCSVGKQVKHIFSLKNIGLYPLTFSFKAGFPLKIEPLDGCIEPLESQEVTLLWIPTGGYELRTYVNCFTNVGEHQIRVTGLGEYPNFTVLNSVLDFGVCPQGSLVSLMFKIINKGNVTLFWSVPNVPEGFKLVNGTTGILKNGSNQDVEVEFRPLKGGLYRGTMVIESKSRYSEVSLKGIGASYKLSIPNELSFKEAIEAGQLSKPLLLKMTNVGEVPLSLTFKWKTTEGDENCFDETFDILSFNNFVPNVENFQIVTNVKKINLNQRVDSSMLIFVKPPASYVGSFVLWFITECKHCQWKVKLNGIVSVPEGIKLDLPTKLLLKNDPFKRLLLPRVFGENDNEVIVHQIEMNSNEGGEISIRGKNASDLNGSVEREDLIDILCPLSYTSFHDNFVNANSDQELCKIDNMNPSLSRVLKKRTNFFDPIKDMSDFYEAKVPLKYILMKKTDVPHFDTQTLNRIFGSLKYNSIPSPISNIRKSLVNPSFSFESLSDSMKIRNSIFNHIKKDWNQLEEGYKLEKFLNIVAMKIVWEDSQSISNLLKLPIP